jgi:arylsulfatase
VIEPGTISNEIFAHEDMLPTVLAAVGQPNVKEDLLRGKRVGDKNYKVHLDGYNLLPYLSGQVSEGPRREFLYWNDDGNLVALRYNRWKAVFLEQRAHGFEVWSEPFVPLRVPKLFDLRADPFERADHEADLFYKKWWMDRVFLLVPAQAFVAQWLESFKEFPPRQRPASFSIDQVMDQLMSAGGANR